MVCLASGVPVANHVPDNMNLAGQDISLLASPYHDKEVRKMWTFGHTFNPRITVGNAYRRDRPMVRPSSRQLPPMSDPAPPPATGPGWVRLPGDCWCPLESPGMVGLPSQLTLHRRPSQLLSSAPGRMNGRRPSKLPVVGPSEQQQHGIFHRAQHAHLACLERSQIVHRTLNPGAGWQSYPVTPPLAQRRLRDTRSL